jgi:hypothetical protein
MIHTSEANVSASSGSNANIEVLENGMTIYNGTLPAQFPVKSGRTYIINYTTSNGEKKVLTIGEEFNGWFIGSLFLGGLPAIVDLVTGNVMQVKARTVLPIAYSPMVFIGKGISNNPNLTIVGCFDTN